MLHVIKNLSLFLIVPFIIFGQVDYNTEIQPIFNNNCGNCHIGNSSGDVNLSSYQNVMNSDVIVPFNADDSELYDRITEDNGGGDDMPPGNPELSDTQISLIEDWINEGALEMPASNDVVVTFRVDMTYQEVSELGVHIAGSFQGWDPSASECVLLGDICHYVHPYPR